MSKVGPSWDVVSGPSLRTREWHLTSVEEEEVWGQGWTFTCVSSVVVVPYVLLRRFGNLPLLRLSGPQPIVKIGALGVVQ